MFEKLRRPGRSKSQGSLKKAFSYVVFGAICLVFVFLIPMTPNLLGEGAIAFVDGRPIHGREFRRVHERVQSQYQERLDKADSKLYARLQGEIEKRATSLIVEQTIAEVAASRSGLTVGQKELRDEISQIPLFQEKGQFLYSKYLNFLKSQRLRADYFERSMEKDILRFQWRRVLDQATKGSKLEAKKHKQMENFRVNFKYVELDLDTYDQLELSLKESSQKLNEFLKSKKVEWEDTGEFDFFSAFGIPITTNKKIMDEVAKALPKKGLIKKIIKDKDKVYLVEILSFAKKSPSETEKKIQELFKSRSTLSDRVYANWFEHYQKKIKVVYTKKVQRR